MMSEEQDIFVNHPSHEIWTALHPALDGVAQTGNAYRHELDELLRRKFPQAVHYAIKHVHFADVLGAQATAEDMRNGSLIWVGSEYCEGLLENTESAIEQGFRGFVTAPLHLLTEHRIIEDWMLDAIKESLSKWRRHVHSG
jgi:hypothetical protein